jgi:eukaryotic-like serine/threonine-protein kinase
MPTPLLTSPTRLIEPHGPLDRLGPYELLEVVGEGGMGVVWKARNTASGATVALKTVNRITRRRLLALRAEVGALRSVSHHGVVRLIEEGITNGIPWYAMELLEGETLAAFNARSWNECVDITRSGVSLTAEALFTSEHQTLSIAPGFTRPALSALRVNEVVELYRSLCEPLAHIHRRGLLHRDLKPQNVFIRVDGSPVIMDLGLFGHAMGAMGREVLDVGDRGFGSVHYVSPERIAGQQVDWRSDLYALGCMLYESLAGRPPFVGSPGQVLAQHQSTPASPPLPSDGELAAELNQLTLSLLEKVPRDRTGHAEDVSAVFDRMLGKLPAASKSSLPSLLFRPQLWGRETELRALTARLELAKDGQGQVVFLRGESGVGKTFLLSTFVDVAVKAGFRVVTGEALPLGVVGEARAVAGAFQPLERLLRSICDACLEGDADLLERLAGETAQFLTPYEAGFSAFISSTQTAPDTLPGAASTERVLEAFLKTLRRFTELGPLAVVLDDMHWSDELSLRLVEHVNAGFLVGLPLVVILAYRPDEASDALRQIGSLPHVQNLELCRLSSSEVRQMAHDMLGVSAPEPLEAVLVTGSEGIPFFVAEYLRYFVAQGYLQRDSGVWHYALPPEHVLSVVPERLDELLRGRVAALAPAQRKWLGMAAALGRLFEVSVLAPLSGNAEEELLDGLQLCRDLQIIERSSERSYRFAHERLVHAALAELDDTERLAVHARAASILVDSGAANPAEVARHYHRADMLIDAVRYYELAGEAAKRQFSWREATDYYRLALQLGKRIAVEPRHLAELNRQVGLALHDLGEFQRSREHLNHALTALRQPALSASATRLVLGVLREVALQTLHRLLPPAWFAVGGDRKEAILLCAEIYDRLQQAAYYSGEVLPMLYTCLKTLNLAGVCGASPTLTTAYTNAHAVAGVLPAPSLATRYFHLASAVKAEASHAVSDSYFHLLTGVYFTGQARFVEATLALDEAISLCRSTGYTSRAVEAVGALSIATFIQGQFDLAKQHALTQAELVKDNAHKHCWALLSAAQVELARGNLASTAAALENVEAKMAQVGRPERVWKLGLEAYLLALENNVDAADRVSLLGLRETEQSATLTHYTIDAIARIAEVRLWIARRRGSESKSQLQRSLKALGALQRVFPIAGPRVNLVAGIKEYTLGNLERARAMIGRSADSARQLGMPYDEFRAQLALVTITGESSVTRDCQAWAKAQGVGDLALLRLD